VDENNDCQRGLVRDVGNLENIVKKPASIHALYNRFSWARQNAMPWNSVRRFDILHDDVRSEVPLYTTVLAENDLGLASVSGAVQPVWLTVRVPKDAAAGEYRGALTVKAEGAAAVEVPVRVTVCGFDLPDTRDFQTVTDLISPPEILAARYKVALWSDEHFRLIENSMRILATIGNKTIYLPLICKTYFGNDESMVRWVKKGEGKYEHDFSILERYIDTALRVGLKPLVVCLYVWDTYCGSAQSTGGTGGMRAGGDAAKNVVVSGVDPATGKAAFMEGPKYTDPGSVEFWRPVAEGVRKRLAARGLEKGIMVGYVNDAWPLKEVVDVWKNLLPEAPWFTTSHMPHVRVHDAPVGFSIAKVPLGTERQRVDPACKRYYGWKREPIWVTLSYWGGPPLGHLRVWAENGLEIDCRGFGRLGADVWGVPYPVIFKYPQAQYMSGWSSLEVPMALFAPGPKGAVPTIRFEMLREGVQECEARIAIEKALTDPARRAKLGEERAEKLQAILDERSRFHRWMHMHNATDRGQILSIPMGYGWYAGSGWQERTKKLFDAAAEAAEALTAK